MPTATAFPDVASVGTLLPSEFQTDSRPVLDAALSGLAAMAQEHEQHANVVAAQADVLRATGDFQNGLGDDRGVARAPSEPDRDYRARLLEWHGAASPQTIITAVNSILDSKTTGKAQLVDRLDAWFPGNGWQGAGCAFVGDGVSECDPNYPERLYPADTEANGGYSRTQCSPGGARAFDSKLESIKGSKPNQSSRCNARRFWLRIPQLSAEGQNSTFPGNNWGSLGLYQDGWFPGDGVSNSPLYPTNFIGNSTSTNTGVYQAICSTVARLAGQGIRFDVIVDPKLK